MSIEVRNICKRFGSFQSLQDVSLVVPDGQLVALLGPSGSGKTTLLRVIAGLETPDSGTVSFDGEESTRRRTGERGVGFVFQHYSLFRHMTVFDNVAFGLTVKPKRLRPSKAAIREKVMSLLKMVQLDWLADRYPSQLSGGQRQRVALARAMAVEPKVLLLDEPFGSLDAKVRQELRLWLRRLHDEIQITSLFVTHDQEEALEVSDRIVLMNQGRIEQEGAPEEVYHKPVNPFVYQFLGKLNLFRARIENGHALIEEVVHPGQASAASGKAIAYVRPHRMCIERAPSANGSFASRVRHINAAGPTVKVELTTGNGQTVQAEMSHDRFEELVLGIGEMVFVSPLEMRIFDNGAEEDPKTRTAAV